MATESVGVAVMLSIVENKQKYLEKLKLTVERVHECSARHCMSVAIQEEFQGLTIWNGHVEVFDIKGHPHAHICYAWAAAGEPAASSERFITVLGIPPVVSPLTAVRAAIVADTEKHFGSE